MQPFTMMQTLQNISEIQTLYVMQDSPIRIYQ